MREVSKENAEQFQTTLNEIRAQQKSQVQTLTRLMRQAEEEAETRSRSIQEAESAVMDAQQKVKEQQVEVAAAKADQADARKGTETMVDVGFGRLRIQGGVAFTDFGDSIEGEPYVSLDYSISCLFASEEEGSFLREKPLGVSIHLLYNGLTFEELVEASANSIEFTVQPSWTFWSKRSDTTNRGHEFAVIATAGMLFVDNLDEDSVPIDSPLTGDNDFLRVFGIGARFSSSFWSTSPDPDVSLQLQYIDIEDIDSLDVLLDFRLRVLPEYPLYLFLQGYLGDSGSEGVRYGVAVNLNPSRIVDAIADRDFGARRGNGNGNGDG
ncbi:MAG: hypothetical protein ACFB20_03215 [Opitutales bacterium]